MVSNYDNPWMQRKLEAPMPLIGIYVALASLACSLTMAADLLHGFRRRKLWFPSKYFSLNATSLTLLAVALKLPIDLTTNMSALTDRLAKISSLSLISTATAHFIPSLGAMSDGDILINVTALAILIVTVVADVCIQIVGTRSFLHHRVLFPEEILALIFMLLLLLVLGSTSIMVLTTKKFLEAKYQEKHKLASPPNNDEGSLKNLVKKYWVMAETSSPQFVIARSSACAAAGVICFANAMLLAQAIVRTGAAHRSLNLTGSSYGSSTKWILSVQTIGVILGTISTSFRWFTAVRFRCSGADVTTLRDEFRVEDYWTRKLLEWKGSSIPHFFRHHRCRKLIYNARRRVVDLILTAQISIVLFNKLVLVISCFVTDAVIKLVQILKKMMNSVESTPKLVGHEILQNIRPNSLRLEGEADLPEYMLQSIPKQVDEVLEAARREKPSGLIEFLRDSDFKFKGVAEFDCNGVPSIHGKEPKNCWSLPVVTLTSIAIALPNVRKSKVDQLVKDVRDGLVFVNIVEKSFYENQDWKNITKAADLWLRVDLFRKWQEIDLAEISLTSSDCKHALRKLARVSKNIASDLKTDVPDCPMFNPANWSPEIIAANSMYRISSTILDGCDEEKAVADEELFGEITRLIADIFAACLTNLVRVIVKKCHLIAIEEREESVRQAALLLGKAEEILEFLQLRDLPAGLNPDNAAAYIEGWRSAMLLENETICNGSGNATASSESSGTGSTPPVTLLRLVIIYAAKAFSCGTLNQ